MWQPLVIFFLIRQIRKTLQGFSRIPFWDKILERAMYAVGILVVIELALHLQHTFIWFWYLLLLAICGIIYKRPELSRVRTVIIAILPLVVLSLLDDFIKLADRSFYFTIKGFLGIAFAVAITWMIAMLVISNKQQKVLRKEQERRQREEEQARLIEARKAELEILVAERTQELTQQKEELQQALVELKTTQAQLIQSEKMASLGELTAGIAHEIQNPLNFVNNFSEVSVELLDELKNDGFAKLPEDDKNKVDEIIQDLVQNLEKISHHGKRADGIVKGMLQHSRTNTGQKELTDINALADEYLRLSYHGLRAKDKSFNAIMETNFDPGLPKISVVPQDLGRVILNLFTNAFYSVNEKKNRNIDGYQPTVSVSTRCLTLADGQKGIEIRVRDNGLGIPQKVIDKIYQPFFSTKPTGQGTGLGLSISYEIITKIHDGEMKVETKEGEFAEFIIQIPQ
jgi:signal transduction histidine kinase